MTSEGLEIGAASPKEIALPRVIYLDQNKWIDLARAVKYPNEKPEVRALLERMGREVEAARLVLPLTSTKSTRPTRLTTLSADLYSLKHKRRMRR